MVTSRLFAATIAAVLVFLTHIESVGQQWWGGPELRDALISAVPSTPARGYYYSLGVKKYIGSFTSYQFPNPFPPGQDPLSRLEFPIDQWFAGATAGYVAPNWTLKAQCWVNAEKESRLMMQDSDWDDEDQPFQKTIFSESQCRLNKGIFFDVGVTLATPVDNLLARGAIRPVVGYRNQYMFFTTHDGHQWQMGGPDTPLPGDGIEFLQVFRHWYVGANLRRDMVLSGPRWGSANLGIELQVDYARVTAKNEDLHLLREGHRVTTENTSGHCWHVFAGISLLVRQGLQARIEGDFKRVFTEGEHNLRNSAFDIDFSFDGSRVWSDQGSISLAAELAL